MTEGSSDKVNYLIRPAKQVERKLIIEALQCLGKKYHIPDYIYVGMGSRYFVDFQMIHKFLGIKDMISFEMDEENIKRFEFNLPYEFIDLQPYKSTDILPSIDWSKDFIIWLDYDQKIQRYMIEDIEIICDNAKPGTILILTPREKMLFDKLIPGIAEKLTHFEMPKDKLHTYEEYYRYYPQYFEAYI